MERGEHEEWTSREVARLLHLLESERRYYQQMVSALPMPLVVLAEDRSILSANWAFCKTFGLENPLMSRTTIDQILPSERLVERIRDAHTWHIGIPNFLLQVNERPLRISILPIRGRDKESEVETLLVVEDLATPRPASEHVGTFPSEITDISERQQPQAHVLGALRMRADMEAVTERITGLTSRLLALTGRQTEVSPPSPVAETIAGMEEATPETAEEAGEFPADISAHTAPLTLLTAEPRSRDTPVTEHCGTIVNEATDISPTKQPEKQLLGAEAILVFQGMASHLARDLNNLLMIISGYGEEIRDRLPEDDPTRADVGQILSATERISGLISRLLEFPRGQVEAPKGVDVAKVVAGMGEKIEVAIGKAGTVELHVEGSAWALAESEQIEEVILAIASTIRNDKWTGSRIVITCTSELLLDQIPNGKLRAGIYTSIAIHRDGPALDPKARAAVCESFRARESEQTSGDTLARAYRTVRDLSGDIALGSERSPGSTFTIYLPQYEPGGRGSGGLAERAERPIMGAGTERNRQTILIVDDEAGIRALVKKILRRERYVVLEAGSAEEAMGVASKHPGRIDLLLTDMMLPGLTGRELAEQMLPDRPELKVVYISGYTDDEGARRGARPPNSKFLQKPFTLEVLVGLVRSALAS